ncbi:MAG: hypothetical protein IIU06_06645, partial [Erysipelotrichales bacterium]|nr:hypothetical protein [Erysipelotrichales bacterium]
GFFATQFLLPLLADHGDAELAYDLLLQENCPGWMYEINNGATTVWERWDALKPDGTVNEEKSGGDNMVSFNHYAFGSVGEFYYRYILGIREETPGFEKMLWKPVPDKRLKEACGTYDSVQGKIEVSWKYENGKTLYCLNTPVNTAVELPDGTKKEVSSGKYTFETEA